MKITASFLLFMSFWSISIAQSPECMKRQWSDTPPTFSTTEYENTKPIVVLKNEKIIELISDKEGSYEYIFTHSFKKVNTDAGIEQSNKIYVFESEKRKIIKNKLRVINPNGTIIELSESDINEAINEDTKQKYKYYAVRGLEKGSIIEEFQIVKVNASLGGKIIYVQNDNYQKNSSYELIFPNYLTYEIKSYNDLPAFKKNDTLYPEKKSRKLILDSVTELASEKYSNYESNLKCFAYKLIANGNRLNLNSFNNVAENVYNAVFKPLDKKNERALSDYLSNIRFPENASIDDSIKKIEHHVKMDILYVERYNKENVSIASIVADKKASEQDLVYFLANLYQSVGIVSEIVITNDRFDFPFDSKFENMSQLESFLLYFPATKQFLSPSDPSIRYPRFPYKNGSNNGLFIHSINIGGADMVMKEVKKINLIPNYAHDSLDITVDFRSAINMPTIELLSSSYGYEAEYSQFLFSIFDDKQKKEFVDNYIKNYTGETETESSYENVGKENVGQMPYVVKTKFQSNKLLEKNAENILFKIGEIIGPQSELYQEKERKTPIDMPFPHTYVRKIKVIIPENYEFNNLEGLKINHELKQNEVEQAGFHSSYTVQGNELNIQILEFYAKNAFPVSAYQDFKNVINAAADFNKIKIILTKKGE